MAVVYENCIDDLWAHAFPEIFIHRGFSVAKGYGWCVNHCLMKMFDAELIIHVYVLYMLYLLLMLYV